MSSNALFIDEVGLILAQNECLWYALHMQVERRFNSVSGLRVRNT